MLTYLDGDQVCTETDHKPLESIMVKPFNNAPTRLYIQQNNAIQIAEVQLADQIQERDHNSRLIHSVLMLTCGNSHQTCMELVNHTALLRIT